MPDPDTIARDTFRRVLEARYAAWLARGGDVAGWGVSAAFDNAVSEAGAAAIRELSRRGMLLPQYCQPH